MQLRYPSRLNTILFLKPLDSLNTLKNLVAVNVKKTYVYKILIPDVIAPTLGI